MQYTTLSTLLSAEGVSQLIDTWPQKCIDSHGPISRLPPLFSNSLLSSIESLTEGYNGKLFEFNPNSRDAMMHPVRDLSAVDVVKRGSTAYLANITSLLPGTDTFLHALEHELGISRGRARLTAFISSAGTGAPVHYDAEDVISIQLVGSKKFFTAPVKQIRYPYGRQYNEGGPAFELIYPQVNSGFPSYKDQSFEKTDMQPGSVLFMPRGTWHHTEAEVDSLSISIVLDPSVQIDHFLSQIKATLLQDPAWRAPCYGFGKTDGVDTKLWNRLSNTIYKLTKNHQNPNSPIRSFQKDSRYVRNPDTDPRITIDNGMYKVEFTGQNPQGQKQRVHLNMPAEGGKVFQWMANTDKPFTVKECMKSFPQASLADLEKFFASSEETGFLKKLWFIEI